jgi:hypothetical protein
MAATNKGYCNTCKALVPARHEERDGKVFLVKDCPDCGQTETLVSADAERYFFKRSLDAGHEYVGCTMDCLRCDRARRPHFAFVNVTNRCNQNCPICIDNVPALGFSFEPPFGYFEALFSQLAQDDPKPTVALFGGEPTVREDLLDIIALARSHGLRARVLTNGLRLADPEYCRKLVESRAQILLSYDGRNPETYRHLRGRVPGMKRKQKAIENLAGIERVKRNGIILIMCVAKGLNDDEVGEYLEFCHGHRDILDAVYLMPLAHTWESADSDFEPERITPEDVEGLVDEAFEGYRVDFLPAGFVATAVRAAGHAGFQALPFLGAHPNCESICMLVSDGEKYVPMQHYLRRPMPDAARALLDLEERVAAREERWQRSVFGRALGALRLRGAALKLMGRLEMLGFILRQVRVGRVFRGTSVFKLLHALAIPLEILLGRRRRDAVRRHTNLDSWLQVVVLPFEDDYVLETERIERCPNAHAFLDPDTGKIKYVPICAWRMHNRTALKALADSWA